MLHCFFFFDWCILPMLCWLHRVWSINLATSHQLLSLAPRLAALQVFCAFVFVISFTLVQLILDYIFVALFLCFGFSCWSIFCRRLNKCVPKLLQKCMYMHFTCLFGALLMKSVGHKIMLHRSKVALVPSPKCIAVSLHWCEWAPLKSTWLPLSCNFVWPKLHLKLH